VKYPKIGEYKWDMAEIMTDKCMMQYVQSADSLVKFPLNQLKEDRFTAGTATNQEIDSKGN
jgi:hypothetical protein